jgi:putative membrane protein
VAGKIFFVRYERDNIGYIPSFKTNKISDYHGDGRKPVSQESSFLHGHNPDFRRLCIMLRRTATAALSASLLSPLFVGAANAQSASSSLIQLRQQLLAASTFSLNTSAMAVRQAQAPAVKTFAGFEAAEQQAEMQAMKIAGLPIPAEVRLDAQKTQMMKELQGLSGAQFDRMYLQGQDAGHRELLTLHQNLLTSGTREEQIIATLGIASIQQHIAMLKAMA